MQREEGFLSPEMSAEITVFRSRYPAWVALLQRLNRLAMTVLYSMRVNFNDHQKLCEAALFCKAVQHLQAGCLLVGVEKVAYRVSCGSTTKTR